MKKLLRLLVVEDSEDDTMLLLRTLRHGGYQPFYKRVEDAQSMTLSLQHDDWDIIICDYALPQFNGMAALELVKSHHIDIPFIIVSGVIGEETAVAAMKAGAHDYLMKGNLERLLPAIERELREAAERRARRVAEEEIRKLSSALAQSASLVMIINPSGIIEYINPTFAHVTGYKASEIVGQSWDFMAVDPSSERDLRLLASAVRVQDMWNGELQIIKKSMERFWAHVTLSPVKDTNDITTHLLFIAEDITERRKLESEIRRYNKQLEEIVKERTTQLQQAKEEIETILNTTNDAVALTLPNGFIQKTNPAFKRILGNRVNRSIENLLWILSEEKDIEMVGEALLSAIYDQHHSRIEANIYTDDDKQIDADLAFMPVAHKNTEKSGFVLSLRDISHLKEVERFKARFVANATHDLSNPISVIRFRLALLQHAPEQLTEHARIIEQQIDRLENLVAELRTLSEIDQGKATLSLQQLDLNELIATVVEYHQPIAQNEQQVLSFKPNTTLPLFLADNHKMERVVSNLIANALNYTPRKGKIRIKSYYSSDFIKFSVHDTGIGIAQEDLPHIFERFYRTTIAQNSNEHGTGLGLAITKEIVELHKGNISVCSKLNIGTVFTVKIPRSH